MKPQNSDLAHSYRDFWSLPDIFAELGDPAPGFATQHDDFAISHSRLEAIGKVKLFLRCHNEKEAREKFTLCAQSQWQYERAMRELSALDVKAHALEITYRPFDDRWTIWDRNVTVHRRVRVTSHLLQHNIALVVAKNWAAIGTPTYDGVSVSAKPVELNYFRRGGEFLFPIYIYNEGATSKTESFSPAFRSFLDERYDGHHYEAEQILGYIYAILHAPTYRRRYAEFLRIDFPRIPFADKRKDFETLSRLGAELIEAHLLKDFLRRGLADYHGRGDNSVEKPRYVEAEERIFINDAQSFAPVPKAVWEFHIGGYQVLDKYLKSRKGRTLSLDEINHVAAVADVLAFTIEQMEKVDDAWRKAFPDRG